MLVFYVYRLYADHHMEYDLLYVFDEAYVTPSHIRSMNESRLHVVLVLDILEQFVNGSILYY